jgi:hypothetical protein
MEPSRSNGVGVLRCFQIVCEMMTRKPDAPPSEHPPRKLDPKVDAMIGAKLRGYYDGLVAEPVPDRILELIAKLDARERRDAASAGTDE